MKKTLKTTCVIFIFVCGNNVIAQDTKIDMNKIIKNTEKTGAETLCNKGNLLGCLNVTKNQCMSEIENIVEVCSSKYLHNSPNINNSINIEKDLDEIESLSYKFGECVLNDYLTYKGANKKLLSSCLTRSNKALQPTQKPRG